MRKFAVFSSNKTTNRTKHPQNERSGNWRQPVHLHWEISKMTEHRQVNWGKKNKNHQQTQNMFSSSNMKSFLFLCARITSTCTWNRRRQVQTKQLITSQTLLSSRNWNCWRGRRGKLLYTSGTLGVQTWQLFQTYFLWLQQTSKLIMTGVVKNLRFGGGSLLKRKKSTCLFLGIRFLTII